MSLEDVIHVNEFSRPLITKQLLDFRNDSIKSNGGAANSQNIVSNAGMTFQLIIKRIPVGIRVQDGYPQVYDADSNAIKYDGLVGGPSGDTETGVVSFQLDLKATCCYGNYVAEFRWWNNGVATTEMPTDRVVTTLVVDRAVHGTYP